MTADHDPPTRDRPRTAGPADVPVALLLAARRGDPAAFARFVEHWDEHLRRFVHAVLAGTGSTDRVLTATYISAYRALPRYRADRTPGLWLHRLAFLAATDEIRRLTREPLRRRGHAEPAEPSATDPVDALTPALAGLAPDQRALLVLVEVEAYGAEAAADAFGIDRPAAETRLAAARKKVDPKLLAAGPVPPPDDRFWADLGRRLLTERERPAAPTIDPAARVARSHPSDPGFRAAPGSTDARSAVASLADRADRARPPRRWGRALAIAAGVLVVLAVVAGAVAVGISGRTPDGSVTGSDLSATVATAVTTARYLEVDVRVTEPGARPESTAQRLTLADDGSWSVRRTDAIDVAAFDSGAGVSRRVVLVDGGPPPGTVLAAVSQGLAAGPPDPGVEPPPWLADLAAVGVLLRGDGDRRAPQTGTGETPTWTYTRTADTGPGGAAESWAVEVRRADGTPLRIERRQGGALVRRVRFGRWSPIAEVPDETFSLDPPPSATTEDHGFRPADLPAVAFLGRGEAVTPSWLPVGFALFGVFLLGSPPAGTESTGGGENPADRAVMSLAYQRGPERITVTTRARGGQDAVWVSPFDGSEGLGTGTEVGRRTLGDGRFNQVEARVTTDPLGRARLWGMSGDVVFTVGGDLTVAEAVRLATGLR